MKKVIRIVIDIILSSIPAFLSYLASSTIFFDSLQQAGYLGQGVNIAYIQDCCLWIGIVLTALFSTARLIYRQWKLDNTLKQRSSLIRMNKRILENSLSEKVSEGFANCDIRIFVPKHPLLYQLTKIKRFHNMKREFIIKNYDTIANEGTTKNLTFEVYPNIEGLVGQCYNGQSIVYDDNLKQTKFSRMLSDSVPELFKKGIFL